MRDSENRDNEFSVVDMQSIMSSFKAPWKNDSKRSRISRTRNRDKVLMALSKGDIPKCVGCGFKDIRALQIDHVYGGGGEDFKQYKNNRPKYYKSMLGHLEDFQILCANCNTIKRVENFEYTMHIDIRGV